MKSSMCQNQSSRLCWKSGIVSHSGAYGHLSKLEVQFWTFRYLERHCVEIAEHISVAHSYLKLGFHFFHSVVLKSILSCERFRYHDLK
ncbi:hypothetical protein HanPSC8_Chr08g0319421 [Helianthus annuus]|nr:hypothetical protein HanPSC8_Chr08g0319421 [Helianthus annuus]